MYLPSVVFIVLSIRKNFFQSFKIMMNLTPNQSDRLKNSPSLRKTAITHRFIHCEKYEVTCVSGIGILFISRQARMYFLDF